MDVVVVSTNNSCPTVGGIPTPVIDVNTGASITYDTCSIACGTVTLPTTSSSGTSYWVKSASDIYYTGGNVFINKTTGTYPLDIDGDININTGHVYRINGSPFAFSDLASIPTTLTGYGITDSYTQTELQTSGSSTIHYDNLSNVPTSFTPDTHASSHETGGTDLIDHDSLTGFVANEHINHTSVSITAGTGLSGGGDISSSRTLSIDSSYSSFTSYYTKTNIQTSGQASVHWDNLTNTPTTIVGYGITDDVTTFLGLSDTPGSFTADKWLKVNAGGTSVEFTDMPETLIEYSATGSGNPTTNPGDWDSTYLEGTDKYIIFSTDEGTTWSNAAKFIGDNGTNGSDGDSITSVALSGDDLLVYIEGSPTNVGTVVGADGSDGADGDIYNTTSTTSLAIPSVGDTVNLTLAADVAYSVGQYIVVSYDSSNQFIGRVLSYSTGTDVVSLDVTRSDGSGTYASWTLNLAGAAEYSVDETGNLYELVLSSDSLPASRTLTSGPSGWSIRAGSEVGGGVTRNNAADLIIQHDLGRDVANVKVKYQDTSSNWVSLEGSAAYSNFATDSDLDIIELKSFTQESKVVKIFITLY